jgi:Histone-like transcription factor (CBF/NF-Y) and archaeal histone
MLSSEANDISEKEAKKTIAVEHIEKALRELGFGDYVAEVVESAGEFKDMQKVGGCLVMWPACCRRVEGSYYSVAC